MNQDADSERRVDTLCPNCGTPLLKARQNENHLYCDVSDCILSYDPDLYGTFTESQTIKWTTIDGAERAVKCSAWTLKKARRRAVKVAREFGWTPPKWWQWWRWSDTRIPKHLL